MGARPSQFKKSGGFLNGVDGVIQDYQFTDEFNGVAFVAGKDPKTKKEKFHSLYCALTVLVDGADEPVTTTLFVGGAEDFEVSDDGHTLTPVEDGRELGASTPFAKLITSLCEAGFPESMLSETEIDYTPIIGSRVRFVQKRDEQATKDLGKRKGKNGKEYDRQDLVIEQVYDLPKAAGKVAAGKPATANPKAGKLAKSADVDIAELSGRAIIEILERAKGKDVAKSKLSTLTLTTPLLKGHPNREDVRKWLFDDDNLDSLASDNTIAYDAETQMISAAA